jgi:proline racemase
VAPAPPVASIAPADPHWRHVVAELDAARSDAFVARDAAMLDAVYVPDSPARDADAARIATLHDAGIYPDGARHQVTSVRVVGSEQDGTAIVAVVEDQPAAGLYDSQGTLIGRSPAVGETTVLLHLDSTGDGYRISRVEQG